VSERNFGRDQRGLVTLGWPAFALTLLLAPMCRDFGGSVTRPSGSGATESGGAGAAGVGRGGDGGMAGHGGAGAGNGNESGDAGADRGGAGGSRAGMGGNAGRGIDGGSGGDGGDQGPGPEPGELGAYGAVRLLVDGVPVCGGTLITNSWVLTADRCIPFDWQGRSIKIGFGVDSTHFHQQKRAIEIQRFPGNDGTGTEIGRERDLALVGVEEPFAVNGKTSQHFIQAWPSIYGLVGEHRCLAWDLEPDVASPTERLRSELLETLSHQPDNGDWEEHVVWGNTDPVDLMHGTLLTSNDFGSGCFIERDGRHYLMSAHSECPGAPSPNERACSVTLNDSEIQNWLDQTLFQVLPRNEVTSGQAAVCSFGRESLEVFVKSGTTMGWWRQGAWPSARLTTDPFSQTAPLPYLRRGSASFEPSYRPAANCAADGSIEIFAVLTDGSVSWQRYRYDPKTASMRWADDWIPLEGVVTTSGLSVAGIAPGHFHLFGRGPDDELRHSEYVNGGWLWVWENLGGVISGAPSAQVINSSWYHAFVRLPDNSLWAWYTLPGTSGWTSVLRQGSTYSDPAALGWGAVRWDAFSLNQSDVLERTWGTSFVMTTVNLGLAPPGPEITAVSREPGSIDIVGDGWHAIWPRDPVPSTLAPITTPEAPARPAQ
jgi:hypothetical protein